MSDPARSPVELPQGFGLTTQKSRMPAALAAGTAVVLVIAAVVVWASRRGSEKTPAERHLPMGAAEQAYAQHIHFHEPRMARAANFLNQEVTYVYGVVENAGDRTLLDLELTVEFRDDLNQVVLRETRRVFGQPPTPLGGGQSREFEIALESIPQSWNHVYPEVRVTGMVLGN